MATEVKTPVPAPEPQVREEKSAAQSVPEEDEEMQKEQKGEMEEMTVEDRVMKARRRVKRLMIAIIILGTFAVIFLIISIISLVYAIDAKDDAQGNPAMAQGLSSESPPGTLEIGGPGNSGTSSQSWSPSSSTNYAASGKIKIWNSSAASDIGSCNGTQVTLRKKGFYSATGRLKLTYSTNTVWSGFNWNLTYPSAPSAPVKVAVSACTPNVSPSVVSATTFTYVAPISAEFYAAEDDTILEIDGSMVGVGVVTLTGNAQDETDLVISKYA